MAADSFRALAKNRAQTVSASDERFERWIVGEGEPRRRRGERLQVCLTAYILRQRLERSPEVTFEVKRMPPDRKQNALEGIHCAVFLRNHAT